MQCMYEEIMFMQLVLSSMNNIMVMELVQDVLDMVFLVLK